MGALIVNGNRINDEGYDIEVRYLDEAKDGMAEYETRWYNPAAGGVPLCYRRACEPARALQRRFPR